MLYDGALKHLANGKRAMLQGNIPEQNQSLQKAQRIIGELISCLDLQRGAEIADQLLALYTFCYNHLVQSNLEDKPENIDAVVQVLTNLRTGWVELEKSLRVTPEHRADAA